MVSNPKRELRRLLRLCLKDISREKAREQDRKIGELLHLLFHYLVDEGPRAIPENFLIGGYAPMEREVDWLCVLGKEYGQRTCFPGKSREGMKFFRCRFNQLVETREFGVKVRTPTLGMPEVTPDLLIVPGLGFSYTGDRIGRGGGFYDRYLEKYRGLKIGVAYCEQLVEEIPTESHDVKVDFVVSSSGILREGKALSFIEFGGKSSVEEKWK